MTHNDARRGSRIYSKPVLATYDTLVVRLSNSLAWRCPSRLMLAQYNRLVGDRHLDVGPGTGWYLAHADIPRGTDLRLMDLNANSMEMTAARLSARGSIAAYELNVLDPLPPAVGEFDSIGVNYLFHCVPGTWAEKGIAFTNLAEHLADGGVLFGATILGHGVRHNLGGRGLMALYNRLGIFHNRRDDAEGLRTALELSFDDVNIEVVGTVAVFSARRRSR